MVSQLLRQAAADKEKQRLQKAADNDRDPADLDIGGTPDWEKQQKDASDPASDSACGKAGEEAGEKASGIDGLDASDPDGGKAGGPAAGQEETAPAVASARPPRRRGRPRGPERVKLSVRITRELDAKLCRAVEETSLSPQYIVEQALAKHFRSLGIKGGD
jgi:hypothetical protein